MSEITRQLGSASAKRSKAREVVETRQGNNLDFAFASTAHYIQTEWL